MKQPGKHVSGSWALVTGGSSGIGEEFARQEAASGIHVVRLAAADLGRDGILDRVAEATGGLDIGFLVFNAGVGNPGPFISLPRERLREIVQLNVIAHLDLAHHFGQRLARRGPCPLNLGEALHVELSGAGVDQGSCGRGDQSEPRGVPACALNCSGLALGCQQSPSRSPLVSTGKEIR